MQVDVFLQTLTRVPKPSLSLGIYSLSVLLATLWWDYFIYNWLKYKRYIFSATWQISTKIARIMFCCWVDFCYIICMKHNIAQTTTISYRIQLTWICTCPFSFPCRFLPIGGSTNQAPDPDQANFPKCRKYPYAIGGSNIFSREKGLTTPISLLKLR
jgi:hypothetical protein